MSAHSPPLRGLIDLPRTCPWFSLALKATVIFGGGSLCSIGYERRSNPQGCIARASRPLIRRCSTKVENVSLKLLPDFGHPLTRKAIHRVAQKSRSRRLKTATPSASPMNFDLIC